VSPAKAAEPIVRDVDSGGLKEPYDGGPDPHTRRRNFEGEKEPTRDDMRVHGRRTIIFKATCRVAPARCACGCRLGYVLDGGHWRLGIRLNRPCAAAMRPFVQLLWPLVKIVSNGARKRRIESEREEDEDECVKLNVLFAARRQQFFVSNRSILKSFAVSRLNYRRAVVDIVNRWRDRLAMPCGDEGGLLSPVYGCTGCRGKECVIATIAQFCFSSP